MAWRNAVNGVLQQLTGYQLRRVTVPAARTAPAAPAPAPDAAPAPVDVRRHMTSGRLSEMFGSGQVETDAFLRT
ncbi:penicillin acylase family protein, partial [Streptomyces californicus]